MLLYLVLLLIAGSLFVAVNASPGLNHLVNTGINSRTIVVLSAITVMQGCKLYNGSIIVAALMAIPGTDWLIPEMLQPSVVVPHTG